MSTAALAIANVELWQADMYSALEQSSRTLHALRNQRNAMRATWHVYKINSASRAMLEYVDGLLDGSIKGKPSTKTTDQVQSEARDVARTLTQLTAMLSALVAGAEDAGMLNSSVAGPQFRRLRLTVERLDDLVVWLEEVANAASFESRFARSSAEFDRGDYEEMADVLG